MKKFSIILAALATLLFSSCSKTFYQVYQVEGDQMNVTDEAIVFDNDDCSVLYNLWSSGGNMSFLFTNKTDHSLYLIMSESFYIQNGEARDYYKEGLETFTKTLPTTVLSTILFIGLTSVNSILSGNTFAPSP